MFSKTVFITKLFQTSSLSLLLTSAMFFFYFQMNKLSDSVDDADSDQEGDPGLLLDEWIGELNNLSGVSLNRRLSFTELIFCMYFVFSLGRLNAFYSKFFFSSEI